MSKKSNLVFKLVVLENGEEKYSANLSYRDVYGIVANAPNDRKEFFTLAARHPSPYVRQCVADKNELPIEAVEILAQDNSVEVLRALVTCSTFAAWANEELLERMIKLDPGIAENIANNIDSFEQADAAKLAKSLLDTGYPEVAAALAGSYQVPKKIKRALLNHSDPYVVSEAKSGLE